MDGMEIINNFKKETSYEFSEAVPAFDGNIYFIFKVDIISIEANPSKTRIEKLKKLIRNKENSETLMSHIDIESIAYLLKTEMDNEDNRKYEYTIESIDEKYDSFIEKNKNKLLEKFLEEDTI